MSIYIDNFDAIYGVKTNIQALRNKVLELAVRGKLVEQDPNDLPASDLIEKIKAEKDNLVKEGKLKNNASIMPIGKDEIEYEVPGSWKWVRLNDFVESVTDGVHFAPKYLTSGVPCLSAKDIYLNKINLGNCTYISEEDYELMKDKINVRENSILITKSGSIGRSAVVKQYQKFGLVESVGVINSILTYAPYIKVVLDSIFCNGFNNEYTNGIGVKHLTLSLLRTIKFPLPPLAEQQRIVVKVESVMAEIDKLEEFLQEKEKITGLLPKAVVDAIGSCKNGEELKVQLQFVISNFEAIFQTPESMQDLRNVILQLAIEGKLVPQDPNDEPASGLIKKIRVEKDVLEKEGKIKKQKPAAPIQDDEIPFEMPGNWQWAKLGDVANLVMGQSPDGELVTGNVGEGIEFHQGKTNFDKKYLKNSEKYTKYPTKIAPQNSLLISVRAPVGTLNYTNRDICIGRGLAALIPFDGVHLDYLFFAVTALQGWLIENATGTTFKAITGDVLSSLLIPIPPFAEQHRIVAKVESIMVLIDQMEDEMKRKVDLVEKMASA